MALSTSFVKGGGLGQAAGSEAAVAVAVAVAAAAWLRLPRTGVGARRVWVSA